MKNRCCFYVTYITKNAIFIFIIGILIFCLSGCNSRKSISASLVEIGSDDIYKAEAVFKKGWSMNPSMNAVVLRLEETHTVAAAYNNAKINVTWDIEDKRIAGIDNNGVIHPVTKGVTTITAIYGNKEVMRLPVYVERETPPPLSPVVESRFRLVNGIYKNPGALRTNQATLMFMGDLMGVYDQQIKTLEKAQKGTYNFNASFDYVKDIFRLSDLAIGNLETTLSQSAPYKHEQINTLVSGGIHCNCNSPVMLLDALRYAGFDALVAANNHCMDVGVRGILETIDNLEHYCLPQTGIFASENDKRHMLFDVNGIRIGFLSYTISISSRQYTIAKKDLDIYTNQYSARKAGRDIALLRGSDADYIFVHISGDSQSVLDPAAMQLRYAQELANAGADYVLGAHPQVLPKFTVLKAADGRNVPVAHSLGNLCSKTGGAGNDLNSEAVILQIELVKDAQGTHIMDAGYIPCFMYETFQNKSHVIVPFDDGMDVDSGIISLGMDGTLEKLSYH